LLKVLVPGQRGSWTVVHRQSAPQLYTLGHCARLWRSTLLQRRCAFLHPGQYMLEVSTEPLVRIVNDCGKLFARRTTGQHVYQCASGDSVGTQINTADTR